MTKRILCFTSCVLTTLVLSLSAVAQNCENLTQLNLDGVAISKAASTPASEAKAPGNPFEPPMPALPAHCLVQGMIDQRTGVGGKTYGMGFELRLPISAGAWNGRFLFQGGGGTDGVVRPAIGGGNTTDQAALVKGFAVVSTDAGHQGQGPEFGVDQQARIDYAYNALGRVTGVAKQIVARYYGKPAVKSYFMGCSNGGRQGMMAAQRFPTLFDGIIAGDPGYRLSKAAMAEAWDNQAFMAIAPKDDSGKKIFSQALTEADLSLLSNAVLEACDAKDGLKDGLIDNPQACRFDPAVLACKGGNTNSCLSEPKINAMKKIFSGAVNSRGDKIYSDWPWDGGIGAPGWRAWKLGNSKTPQPNAINMTLGTGSLKMYFMTPFDEKFDPLQFDFDKDPAKVAPTTAINDSDSTQLSTFAGRGGKLMLYHGMSDPVFSANDTIRYYQQLGDDNGGSAKVLDFARLYLIPGMNHCAGGPALDQFDALTALVDWVEKGNVPESLRATGAAFPGRSRPMCSFPQQPHYKGTGSSEDSSNFDCR
jgi:pimeloyl-ACP methyl ester carboxylesterase